MFSNAESIAQGLKGALDGLINSVRTVEGQQPGIYETEEQLWIGLLALGRGLMQLRFEACHEAEVIYDRVEVEGENYTYQRESERAYVSLFGAVRVKRAYYLNKAQGGWWPLDTALSLPERSYSDSVQERLSEMNAYIPQETCLKLLERWLGLKLPKGSLQSSTADQALYMPEYYDQQAPLTINSADSILVVTADGKGIPMTRADSPPPQARRGKGQKKTAKKEAIVTAWYSIAPYQRAVQSLIDGLLPEAADSQPSVDPKRPLSSAKQTFATLDGKTAALSQLAQQLARHANQPFRHRVALCDGAPALQQLLLDYFPDFTLVLDLIHVTEYLWDAANACFGETSPSRLPWMRQALTYLLTDRLDTLLQILDDQAVTCAITQQQTLDKVSAYLQRNRPYMYYHHYLALGWPVATGVVEGACRHLVKDRFAQAGMRWSIAGAQNLLDLRSVVFNDDWDAFQSFRRHQSHLERFGTPYPDVFPDVIALEANT